MSCYWAGINVCNLSKPWPWNLYQVWLSGPWWSMMQSSCYPCLLNTSLCFILGSFFTFNRSWCSKALARFGQGLIAPSLKIPGSVSFHSMKVFWHLRNFKVITVAHVRSWAMMRRTPLHFNRFRAQVQMMRLVSVRRCCLDCIVPFREFRELVRLLWEGLYTLMVKYAGESYEGSSLCSCNVCQASIFLLEAEVVGHSLWLCQYWLVIDYWDSDVQHVELLTSSFRYWSTNDIAYYEHAS